MYQIFFPGQRSKKKPAYICHWLYQFSKWFNCTFFLFWVFFCFVLFCFFVTFFDYRIMTKTSKNSGRPFMDLAYMLMLEDQNALNLNCPAVGWNTHPAWKKGRDRPSSLEQVNFNDNSTAKLSKNALNVRDVPCHSWTLKWHPHRSKAMCLEQRFFCSTSPGLVISMLSYDSTRGGGAVG